MPAIITHSHLSIAGKSIFSLYLAAVPTYVKTVTIVPVLNKAAAKPLNDFRPVALTHFCCQVVQEAFAI